MKLITTTINPSQVEYLTEAVGYLGGIESIAISQVQVHSFGREMGPKLQWRGVAYQSHLVPKVRLDVAVEDQDVERVLTAISTAGGANVWVIPLEIALGAYAAQTFAAAA